MRRLVRMATAGLVLTVLAGACGDDGGGSGAAPVDDPFVQAIVDDITIDENPLTDERADAECFATRVVGAVGNERLAALGVTVDDVGSINEFAWTPAEVDMIVENLFDCIDVSAGFTRSLVSDEMTPEEVSCLEGSFTNDVIRDFYRSTFAGDEGAEFFGQITAAMTACGINPFE